MCSTKVPQNLHIHIKLISTVLVSILKIVSHHSCPQFVSNLVLNVEHKSLDGNSKYTENLPRVSFVLSF